MLEKVGHQWYKFTIESVGVYDMGYKMNHSKRYDGDIDHVVGGFGWELRKDPHADPHQTRTLRDGVLVIPGRGIYLSYGVLNALGINGRGLYYRIGHDVPGILFGTASFFLFNTDMNAAIENHVGVEHRSERERFVQERNAGIWNALLGLAQEWNVMPFNVDGVS